MCKQFPEVSPNIHIANGKAANLVESLMKQKQNITNRKNEMISSTLEKGGNMESISAELESYDEQLKELDKQLFEATKPKEDKPENEDVRSEPQEDEIQKKAFKR